MHIFVGAAYIFRLTCCLGCVGCEELFSLDREELFGLTDKRKTESKRGPPAPGHPGATCTHPCALPAAASRKPQPSESAGANRKIPLEHRLAAAACFRPVLDLRPAHTAHDAVRAARSDGRRN